MTALLVVAAVLATAALAQAIRIGVVRHDWIAIKLLAGIAAATVVVLLLAARVFSGGE